MFPETSNDSSIIHCVDSHMAVKPKQKKKKRKREKATVCKQFASKPSASKPVTIYSKIFSRFLFDSVQLKIQVKFSSPSAS